MGAIKSKEMGLLGRNEFVAWSFDAALRCLGRAVATGSPRSLSRRQFWDVFTDYYVMKDGAFLALDHELFDVFANKPGSDGRVDAWPVVTVLLLHGDVELEMLVSGLKTLLHSAKLTKDSPMAPPLRGNVGGASGAGASAQLGPPQVQLPTLEELEAGMTYADLCAAVSIAAVSSGTIGMLTEVPTDRQLKKMAAALFAEAHVSPEDGRLSDEKLVEWMRTDKVVQAFVVAYKDSRRAALREVGAPKIVMLGQEESGDSSSEESDDDDDEDAGGDGAAGADATGEGGGSGGASAGAGAGEGGDSGEAGSAASSPTSRASKTKKKKKKKKRKKPETAAERVQAMNAVHVASKDLLGALADESGAAFDVKELRGLRAKFVEEAGGESAELSRKQFEHLMVKQFPQLGTSREAIAALFSSFDTDHSNTIDFKEFAVGMSKRMKGTASDKLRLVFEAFSDTGDASVNVFELLEVVRKGNQEMAELATFTESVVAGLDTHGTGVISRSDFKKALLEQPILDECFKKASNTKGMDSVRGLYDALPERLKLSFAQVRAVWTKFEGEGWGEYEEQSLTSFRQFMTREFNASQDVFHVLNKVFDCMNPDKEATIPAKDVFHGLVQVVDASEDQRVEFFFDVFDKDGNGELDMDEIRTLVLSSQEAANESARTAMRVLKELERVGGGRVTLEQFVSHASKNPKLMECFRSLLGVESTHDPGQARLRAQEIRNMLLTGGRGPPGSRATARDRMPTGKGTAQGLARLRKQSLKTAGDILTSLQSELRESDAVASSASEGNTSGPESGGEGGGGSASGDAAFRTSSSSAVRAAAKTYGDMLSRKMSNSLVEMKREVERQRTDQRRRLNDRDSGFGRVSPSLMRVASSGDIARPHTAGTPGRSPRDRSPLRLSGLPDGSSGGSPTEPISARRKKGSLRPLDLAAADGARVRPQVSPVTRSPLADSVVTSPMRPRYGSVATAKALNVQRSNSAHNLLSVHRSPKGSPKGSPGSRGSHGSLGGRPSSRESRGSRSSVGSLGGSGSSVGKPSPLGLGAGAGARSTSPLAVDTAPPPATAVLASPKQADRATAVPVLSPASRRAIKSSTTRMQQAPVSVTPEA